MQPEELMIPRYRVIADYPEPRNHPYYEVGSIIRAITDEDVEYIDRYKALFKKLHWSEGRHPEDLPYYLKFKNDNSIVKVYNYSSDAGGEIFFTIDEEDIGSYLWEYLPATEAEYNAYINKQ
jgi:hypothetical protein